MNHMWGGVAFSLFLFFSFSFFSLFFKKNLRWAGGGHPLPCLSLFLKQWTNEPDGWGRHERGGAAYPLFFCPFFWGMGNIRWAGGGRPGGPPSRRFRYGRRWVGGGHSAISISPCLLFFIFLHNETQKGWGRISPFFYYPFF